MAWTKTSANGWIVATETLTTNTSATDESTSVIDWLPYGKDWYVVLERDAADTLATPCPLDIDFAYEPAGTFLPLKDAFIANIAKAVPAAPVLTAYDNSANGNAPYYKIRLDKPAALSATAAKTLVFRVVSPPKQDTGVVY
jgi:hypothetical protein